MKSVYTVGMINFNKIVIQVQVSHLLLMYVTSMYYTCTPKSQAVLVTSTTGASPSLGKWGGVLGDDLTDETTEKSIYTVLARVYALYWVKAPSSFSSTLKLCGKLRSIPG